jgi:hypothetical protein
MARRTIMQRLARWHIWLGWVVGLPILMWTATGLFMVARPIEEVRGNHLRIERGEEALGPETAFVVPPSRDKAAKAIHVTLEDGQPVIRAEWTDGTITRFDRNGAPLPALDEAAARTFVATHVKGGDRAVGATLFDAKRVPFDFRREMPVWQVRLADGTHVYVGQESARIEAIRTRWWRMFDFMWGLHILDPQEREDSSHPLLIGAALLSVIGALMGCVLLFRRRRKPAATVR